MEKDNNHPRASSFHVSSVEGLNAGDAVCVSGVYSVHWITKKRLEGLKCFRVLEIVSDEEVLLTPKLVTDGACQNVIIDESEVPRIATYIGKDDE